MNELELRRAAGSYRLSQAIHAMAELGIADHLLAGPCDATDLARSIGASEPHLRRLLRALASEGILEESDDGRFAPGEAARLMATNAGLREMLLGWSIMPAGYEAFGRLAEAVRTGRSGFELAHGCGFHAYLERTPDAAARYDAAMESTTDAFDAAADEYPYGDYDSIVDVGGGGGGLLTAILRRHEHVRGIVFDLPAVVAGATVRPVPDAVAGRLTFTAGDFFVDPLPSARLYTLSTVLRLFEDDDAIRLLRSIARAMPPGARVLIMDFLHPPGPLTAPLGLADLQAMVLYGGRDRSASQFEAVLAAAGLRLSRILPSDPPYALIEAELA